MVRPFPYLLLPHYWSSRNRARRSQRGDYLRGALFSVIALLVGTALFQGSFWLTTRRLVISPGARC